MAAPVIGKTLAAVTLAAAGLISTVAFLPVGFCLAFHGSPFFLPRFYRKKLWKDRGFYPAPDKIEEALIKRASSGERVNRL